ncbi:MAG TPA: thiamine phosphate synthase [Terriglobia bacterium]|nr:thiamine phosphate synthase [Terriglobia bacterium]
MPRLFKLCYVTERQGLEDGALPGLLREAIDARIDMIQIRERDLGSRELVSLVKDAVSYGRGTATLITVNDRLDVALGTGTAGVHLGGHSLPAACVRAVAPTGFLVGVSCHSIEDVLRAEMAGADYVLLGPVFETPSKLVYGRPLGLSLLSEAASRTTIPVYALGGVTVDRAMQCLEAGAAGIAGIRLFQDPASLRTRVAQLRAQVASTER